MISKYQVQYSAIISEIQFQPFMKVLFKCAFHSHFLVSFQIFSQPLIITQWFNLINKILSWLCKDEFFVTPWRKILYWQKIHYRLQVEKSYCILSDHPKFFKTSQTIFFYVPRRGILYHNLFFVTPWRKIVPNSQYSIFV